MLDFKEITQHIHQTLHELLIIAKLQPKNIFVVGCSTSEVNGEKIGSASNIEIAQSIFSALMPIIEQKELFLAVQCCEHLNRALIVTQECAKIYNLEEVSVVPHLHAGGALATLAYDKQPGAIAVEKIAGHAGMDIGDTFIGMHLKRVIVPVRLPIKKIGKANLTLARTRPPLIGGERAKYPAGAGTK